MIGSRRLGTILKLLYHARMRRPCNVKHGQGYEKSQLSILSHFKLNVEAFSVYDIRRRFQDWVLTGSKSFAYRFIKGLPVSFQKCCLFTTSLVDQKPSDVGYHQCKLATRQAASMSWDRCEGQRLGIGERRLEMRDASVNRNTPLFWDSSGWF